MKEMIVELAPLAATAREGRCPMCDAPLLDVTVAVSSPGSLAIDSLIACADACGWVGPFTR